MSGKSRVAFFEQRVADAGQEITLRALDFVRDEMNAKKGFARHDGSDYYEHCVDVAQDLWNFGIRDENIISAALLHDTIEDVPGVTFKMLEDKFNLDIANIVTGVTKQPGIDYKEGDNIKTLYLDIMLNDYRTCLVKAADRKHNFSTLRDASPEKKLRQALETEKYFFPFFKEAMKLYPRYSAYFLSAKTAIKPHLLAIKDHHEEVTALKAELEELKRKYNSIQRYQS
jgi:guanosine-3',5'-bis(diphosphate) 3'-pyrophosphohydrolase